MRLSSAARELIGADESRSGGTEIVIFHPRPRSRTETDAIRDPWMQRF